MEQRNLLIAIVLSVGILIAFQFAFERMRPPQPPGPAPGTPATAPATSSTANRPAPTQGVATNVPGAAPAQSAETRDAAIAEQPRVKIETPRLHGSIDLVGGRLDDLTLATYHETVDPKSPEVVLLSPPGTQDPYLAEFGWVAVSPDVKVPGPQTRWTSSGGPLTPTSPVTLTWDNGQGLVFSSHDQRRPNYMFTVRRLGPQQRHHSGEIVAIWIDQPNRHTACSRLLHPVRRHDRLSRRFATGGQVFLA